MNSVIIDNCIVSKIIGNELKPDLNDYTYKHKKIYNFYQYCKKEKPTNSVKHTYNEIITRDGLNISQIPKYIENFFYYIVKELEQAIYNFNKYEDTEENEDNEINF